VVVAGFTKNMSKVKVGMYIITVVYIILLVSPKSISIFGGSIVGITTKGATGILTQQLQSKKWDIQP